MFNCKVFFKSTIGHVAIGGMKNDCLKPMYIYVKCMHRVYSKITKIQFKIIVP